jgi:gamma-glutamyltranspeptidase/glutathione hydrolase
MPGKPTHRFRAHAYAIVFLFIAPLVLIAARVPARAAQAAREMVVAESDEAAKAGFEVLRHGGNAVDAAVAVSLALGVTNSGSCGLGGGGFMLIYWAKTRKIYALDYRERAPMAATSSMYIRGGKADEELARTGPLAVAVPGEAAGLDAALKRFGTVKFSQLAAPAIKLARDGFPLSPHMAAEVAFTAPDISRDSGFKGVFFDSAGAPLKAGATVRNPNLAAMMEHLGDEPARNFYHGDIANQIAADMKERGGLVTARDLAEYQPVWREPIHLPYRGYDVYTMPPPSSAGVMLEMLGMLDSEPIAGLGADSPPYLARLIEVMRQGFIDRAEYADPAFIKVPIARLLSPEHIAHIRALALHHRPIPHVTRARDHGTSNFSVADRYGDAVEVTTTVNTIFGAKIMAAPLGLVLNDEMDDFTAAPGVPNAFRLVQSRANEIAPGKRPESSMSPTIIFRGARPVMAVGGSGGPTIITGVAQVTLDILDFHLDPERAVAMPRIHDQAEPDVVFVEAAMPPKTAGALAQMGYKLKQAPELGATSAITIAPGDLHGAFDPRKGGGVAGD